MLYVYHTVVEFFSFSTETLQGFHDISARSSLRRTILDYLSVCCTELSDRQALHKDNTEMHRLSLEISFLLNKGDDWPT